MLLKPRLDAGTSALWFGPFGFLLGAVAVAYFYFRHRRAKALEGYLSIDEERRLEELNRERADLEGKIDEDLLGLFERLFKSKGDAAVVAIEHGVCTGCHMKVTSATAASARAGKEIVSCENCGRILYEA